MVLTIAHPDVSCKNIYIHIACTLPKHICLYFTKSEITCCILILCGNEIIVKWLTCATDNALWGDIVTLQSGGKSSPAR